MCLNLLVEGNSVRSTERITVAMNASDARYGGRNRKSTLELAGLAGSRRDYLMRFRVVITKEEGQKNHVFDILTRTTLCGMPERWLLRENKVSGYYQLSTNEVTCYRCCSPHLFADFLSEKPVTTKPKVPERPKLKKFPPTVGLPPDRLMGYASSKLRAKMKKQAKMKRR
jgi:hypothetical protein